MAQENTVLTGSSGKQYHLLSEIGSGGEGVVYRTDDPTLVAKVYKRPSDFIQRKVEYMISCPVNSRAPDKNATPIIAWPQDALFENGVFVGYVMPLVADTLPMFQLSRGDLKTHDFFRDYSWLTHLTVAFNLSNTIRYLHSMGMVVGDMNSKNMVVHRNGLVTILDVDSFDLTNPDTGEHFPCVVGRPEFLPPELQGRDLRNAAFTIHSDEFGLAVHIFRLLLHNRHPFDVKVSTEGLGSVNQSKQEFNISMGNCAYVRAVPGCEVPPNEPTMDMLNDALRHDFEATFNYTEDNALEAMNSRTTAEQWYNDLKTLVIGRNALFTRCEKNPEHYYLTEKHVCEFCRVKVPGFSAAQLRAAQANAAAASSSSAQSKTKPAPIKAAAQPAAPAAAAATSASTQTAAATSTGSITSVKLPDPVGATDAKPKTPTVLLVARIAAAVLLVIGCAVIASNNLEKANDLQTRYTAAFQNANQMEEEAKFIDNYVRYRHESSKTYHKYGCTDLDTSSFYAYNVNRAKNAGFQPCRKCCPND